MPSVSPPSDGGTAYRKSVREIEDDFREEAKHNRDLQEQQFATIEDKYKSLVQKKDAELERAVTSTRETGQDQIELNRSNHRAELESLKANNYDRYGRVYKDAVEPLKQQIQSLKSNTDSELDKSKSRLDDSNQSSERHSQELEQRHQEEMEKAITATREAYGSASEKAYEDRKTASSETREQQEKKANYAEQERQEQINQQRRLLNRSLSEMEKSYKHKEEQNVRAQEAHSEASEAALEKAMKDQTERLRSVNQSQNVKLREQVRDLLDTEHKRDQERGDARVNVIREFEDEWKHENKRIGESYQGEIEDLKVHAKSADQIAGHKMDQAVKERDAYTTEVVRKLNDDHRVAQHDLLTDAERARNSLVLQNKHDRELFQTSIESQMEEAGKQREAALQNQGSTYQETLKRQKIADRDQIKFLEHHLHELKTSESPTNVSPAAESNIRKALIREYEKTAGVDQERNKIEIGKLQESYSQQVQDTIMDRNARETAVARENALDRAREKNELLSHIGEIEETHVLEKRGTESDRARESDKIRKNYENIMERQRREYEEILHATSADSQAKMSATRQDLEFSSKMAHRAFNSEKNEIIRDYERKLEDQKRDLTVQVQEAKEEALKANHEAERQTRQALDEQGRAHEQRIAQLEAQHKERERFLNQNYEDDIEKVRRSHALLLQKKG